MHYIFQFIILLSKIKRTLRVVMIQKGEINLIELEMQAILDLGGYNGKEVSSSSSLTSILKSRSIRIRDFNLGKVSAGCGDWGTGFCKRIFWRGIAAFFRGRFAEILKLKFSWLPGALVNGLYNI